ncbi:MAG: hypothetical protein QM767_24030 [Anaeromyxobacter sp.]
MATACTLRTATVVQLAQDQGGGRGRNCLVAAYLDPGSYLLTVRATGRSRGRAGVVLEHRPVRELAPVADDGEAFFRVPAGELVRERLSVAAAGPHALSTSAPGATLQCRLEDPEGWPLFRVPGRCELELPLPAGELLWTQLPLTVESMRHTRLAPVRPPEVLRGEAPHPVALWTPYVVELSGGGHDTFDFTLVADLDLRVTLTNGMQGRLYREGEDRPVELVPAAGGGSPEESAPAQPDEGYGEGEAQDGIGDQDVSQDERSEAPPGDESSDDAPSYDDASADGLIEDLPAPGDPGEEAAPNPAPEEKPVAYRRPPPAPPGEPSGPVLSLAAGRYRLVTEHSRGDVAITYTLQLTSELLTPGSARELPVPSEVTVRLPKAGTLRLRTRGDTDVRCRLFDAAGRLAAESGELGDDWNCALAQPLPAGDYRLALESETQLSGTTRLSLSAPALQDVGALEDGKTYALADQVLTAALPAGTRGAPAQVVEVALASPSPFSCALEDAAGAVVDAQLETRTCTALLHPAGAAYRLRLWTLERPAQVLARLRVRIAAPLSAGGAVAATGAGLAAVAHAGRWRTGAGLRCAPAGQPGLLQPCGPEASLEAGPVLFAAPGAEARVALEELAAAVDAPATERQGLTRRPLVQVQRSRASAVHLLAARAAPGERAAPWCAFEGGVSSPGAAGEAACYAAGAAGTSATARLLAPSDAPVEVELTRAAIALPKPGGRLEPGRQVLTLADAAARLPLPAGPSRLELLLPPAAWAVLLSAEGRALDLCPPAARLARCLLQPGGGELFLWAPEERRVEATLVTLPAPPPERVLGAEPFEARLEPGPLLLRVPAAPAERTLEVSGGARCLVRLSDGSRREACTAPLPAGLAADVLLDAGGPLRALARPTSAGPAAAYGRPLAASAPALRAGEAAALTPAPLERSFTLAAPALVHLRADAGVCALASGAALVAAGGLGGPCALDQLLPAGTHRLAVRPFAGEPPAGAVRFTTEPVEPLTEGAGPERWLGPGETRVFRFRAAGQGRVGVGLQQEAEVLSCTVSDAAQRPLATGCQALLTLEPGDYLLAVHAPPGLAPARFRPVVLGLAGAAAGVPDDYLRDLFQRIGASTP